MGRVCRRAGCPPVLCTDGRGRRRGDPSGVPATREWRAMDGSERANEMKLAKTQRQHRVARLLELHPVASQGQLVELLAAEGVVATQATVSRDLEELGAIKVRAGGGESVYAIPDLPKEQRTPEDHLRRVLGDWVVDVDHSSNLVVLRTPPG